jgi:hypothetical protein
VTTASALPAANAAGWNRTDVGVTLHAVDDPGGSGVASITWSATGAGASPGQTVTGDTATVPVAAEGVTTIAFTARDAVGNAEATHMLVVRVDKTAPTLACSASPGVLSPPDHRLVAVAASVGASDGGSGPAGFVLTDATSSEADNGLGDGDTTGDVQGWTTGTADTAGLLRAERLGAGPGRTYRLTYRATDVAGNSATCTIAVAVPHG